MEKPKAQRPLERPTFRWEYNTEVGFMEMWKGVDCIHLAQDRNQGQAVEIGTEPSGSVPCREYHNQVWKYQHLKELIIWIKFR